MEFSPDEGKNGDEFLMENLAERGDELCRIFEKVHEWRSEMGDR